VAFSPDGHRVAATFFNGAVRVWHRGSLEVEERETKGPVISVAWRPGKEAQLAVGWSKGKLKLLELP
jgi:WD40 repeat protein